MHCRGLAGVTYLTVITTVMQAQREGDMKTQGKWPFYKPGRGARNTAFPVACRRFWTFPLPSCGR